MEEKEVAVEVLDHGYVKLVETWGSDERVIESARMSTQKGFEGWGPAKKCSRCGCKEKLMHDEPTTPEWCWNRKPRLECDFTIEVPGDEKLLRYLWEHQHHTPFEMCGATFEVQAPIFVFREWHRHRVPFGYNEACLAGDTEITCIGSGGLVRHYTIEHIYRMKHEGVVDHIGVGERLSPSLVRNGYSKAGTPVFRERRLKENPKAFRVRKLPSCQHRTLRVLNEAEELFETGEMREVYQSGMKELWLVETDRSNKIKASAEHPFFTREGWKELGELSATDEVASNGLVAGNERPIPPSLRNGIGVWTTMMRTRLLSREKENCYVCGNTFASDDLSLDHVVPVAADLRLALDETNLRPICRPCHRTKTNEEQRLRMGRNKLGLRWTKLVRKPVRVGEGMTYDIEMSGAHHNFVANGLVVHNSARYAPLPDLNYVPTVERLMANAKDGNKQAGATKGSYALTEEHARVFQDRLSFLYENMEELYQWGLRNGVPKELARVGLPVGRYSKMRATSNLRGWLSFLKLRDEAHAQYEIRVYAALVRKALQVKFPRTMVLFAEGQKT